MRLPHHGEAGCSQSRAFRHRAAMVGAGAAVPMRRCASLLALAALRCRLRLGNLGAPDRRSADPRRRNPISPR